MAHLIIQDINLRLMFLEFVRDAMEQDIYHSLSM